jgi:hypothetical protein
MSQISASMAENMTQTPTGKLSKQWPEPQRFPHFLDKMGKMMTEDYDWSAEIAKLVIPVLLVFADNDSVSQKHIAEFFALLGGGVKEPGWLNTQLSKSRLAVLPGYSHYNFLASAEVPQIVSRFLADRSPIRRPARRPPPGPPRTSSLDCLSHAPVAILTRDTGNRSDRITSCLPIIWDQVGQLGCLSRDGPEAQRGPRQLQRLEFGGAREYHLWNREHRDRN